MSCRPGFFLPVRVLSRLFRRLFLERLATAHKAGRLTFFNDLAPLADRDAFDAHIAPLRKAEWVVYAKRPFGGPEAVLGYLARYTHRIAISNSRLIAFDGANVTPGLNPGDYPAKGRQRYETMTLAASEFIRRFLIHTLPDGFHRIRHYGLFANGGRVRNIATARELLAMPITEPDEDQAGEGIEPTPPARPRPCCGGRMIAIEQRQASKKPLQKQTWTALSGASPLPPIAVIGE